MDKRKVKRGIIFAVCILLMYFVVRDYAVIIGGIKALLHILRPLIIGLCIAFILNIPYGAFERLFTKLFKGKRRKLVKIFSLVLTYIAAIAIVSGIFLLIIPQIISSIEMFSSNLETYYQGVTAFLNGIVERFGIGEKLFEVFEDNLYAILQKLPEILLGATNGIIDFAIKFVNTIIDIIIGAVISGYVLYSKRKLGAQINKVFCAIMNGKTYKVVMKFLGMFNGTFKRFIGGQLVEAFIMGAMCYVTMSIFRFEYAFIISVIIGATNVIPIFGPIIGAVPGVAILFMVDPIKSLWFIVMCVVLQQLESNIIYPRVVGESVGLPAALVFSSVILGGGLFGVVGMVLSVPIMSIFYNFMRYVTRSYKEGKRIEKTAVAESTEPTEEAGDI